MIIVMYIVFILITVISEPDDVTICKGEGTVLSCILNTTDSGLTSDDVRWHRLIKDTNTIEMVNPQGSNIHFTTSAINNTMNSSLIITDAVKSYTGYYWIGTPYFDVCNVSFNLSKYTNTTGQHTVTQKAKLLVI